MPVALTLTLAPRGVLRAVAKRLGLETDQQRLLVLMGGLVAVLFGAYTIAKVLRDALFLAEFGALALPYMYVLVALAAAGFVWMDSAITRVSTRVAAVRLQQLLAIVLSVAAALVHPIAKHWTAAVFYVWTGSQVMMLLPHFWALALDVWDSRRARSVFPFLAGCGLFGGLVAGGVSALTVKALGRDGLMWILSGLLVLVFVITAMVEQYRARAQLPPQRVSTQSSWKIIQRSSYIKVLVASLALAVILSTLVDFQFKLFLQHEYPDPHDLTRFLGKFYLGLNALSLLFQFSIAGWVLRRIGLGPATSLQPVTAALFMVWVALGPLWWIVVSLRWLQSVVQSTLGKSTSEIYYTAIHPHERRRIKPAVDTLVERWSDAAVGVLLVVLLHVLGVSTHAVAIATLILAVLWLGILVVLDRQFGRAFEQLLSTRWIEPDEAPDVVRSPSARKALVLAMREGDERRIVLALHLCRGARSSDVAETVRNCLRRPSAAVRVAAVETMRAMGLDDPEGRIQGFLADGDEPLRRVAVRYGLTVGKDRTVLGRRLLEGDDAELRHFAVDALVDLPRAPRGLLTAEWVNARLAAGTREDRVLAARAAGAMEVQDSPRILRTLLAVDDMDVRRAALDSAARRPSHELVDALLPLFGQPELADEARDAVAAIGAPAVQPLERLLAETNDPRTQVLVVRTLGRIATPRALSALMRLVRTTDARLRYLGLQAMSRVRIARAEPVLPRRLVHKLFLRELSDYRSNVEPALRLARHPAPEVRLLGESFGESADMALERAFLALACWYEARPLAGSFEHLRSYDPAKRAPALEYLGTALPRNIFHPVEVLFEESDAVVVPVDEDVDDRAVAEAITSAWRTGDAWLRACAVRASASSRAFDPRVFEAVEDEDPLVQAELASMHAGGGRGFRTLWHVAIATGGGGC